MRLTCSLVETNVAIIVGCMPAFAQLLKVHIGGSPAFKSLRSRLFGSGSHPSETWSKEERPKLATFGATPQNGRRAYRELTDTVLLNSQATVIDNAPAAPANGIIRSVGISQQFRYDSSDETLA